MKSARARWRAHRTLGATRRWTTTGYATAQWKARSARRCQPPPGPTLTNVNFFSFCGGPNPCPLDQSSQAKHHHFDPRKQTPGGRHQIGTPAGFKSESVAGFLLECVAGFVGIRTAVRLSSICLMSRHLESSRRTSRRAATMLCPNLLSSAVLSRKPFVLDLRRLRFRALAASARLSGGGLTGLSKAVRRASLGLGGYFRAPPRMVTARPRRTPIPRAILGGKHIGKTSHGLGDTEALYSDDRL